MLKQNSLTWKLHIPCYNEAAYKVFCEAHFVLTVMGVISILLGYILQFALVCTTQTLYQLIKDIANNFWAGSKI